MLTIHSGPAYCCLECKIFIHESCSKAPRRVQQHQFHPQHPLVWHFIKFSNICKACKLSDVGSFCYHCSKCSFHIHSTCANYLTSPLKYKSHEHSLFCFKAQDLGVMGFIPSADMDIIPSDFQCKVCDRNCSESFYRCLVCDLNLHLECIPVPKKVKGSCHIHPLSFVDSVVQDCWEEQYCYACENIRNPNHAAYSCEKCIYIAHIGCVLVEEDTSLQILSSSTDPSGDGDFRSDFGETSGRKIVKL